MPFFAQEPPSLEIPRKAISPATPLDASPPPLVKEDLQPFPGLTPRLGDGLYLMGPDGKPQFVPAQPDIKEFLEWKRKQLEPARIPDYSFSDVSLEGTASENEVVLTARFTLQIPKDKEWVRVPLELHEAVLRKFRYEYQPLVQSKIPTVGKAGFDRFDRQTGLHWWFLGQGQHVLTLEMIVPIKKASGTRRIQLAVPSAASSYLRLNLSIPQEQLALDPILAGCKKSRRRMPAALKWKSFD